MSSGQYPRNKWFYPKMKNRAAGRMLKRYGLVWNEKRARWVGGPGEVVVHFGFSAQAFRNALAPAIYELENVARNASHAFDDFRVAYENNEETLLGQ